MVCLYIDTLTIGHKLKYMLSILENIALQKTWQQFSCTKTGKRNNSKTKKQT